MLTLFKVSVFHLSIILTIVVSDRKESERFYFFKPNEVINLDNILPCEGWLHNDKPHKKEFEIVQETAGFYYCPSTNQTIFVLVKVRELTFEYYNSTTRFVTGETAAFRCSVSFRAHRDDVQMDLSVHDESRFYYKFVYDSAHAELYEEFYSFAFWLSTGGVIPFYCNWTYWATHRGIELKYSEIKKLVITVFNPPINVRPDKYKWTPNEAINCISDGYPEAKFKWRCGTRSCSANGSSLVCTKPGRYACTCSAYNVIKDVVEMRVWKGSVSVSDSNKGYFRQDISEAFVLLVGLAISLRNVAFRNAQK